MTGDVLEDAIHRLASSLVAEAYPDAAWWAPSGDLTFMADG